MKIRKVAPNNRRKAFEINVSDKVLSFPYARLRLKPSPSNPVVAVYVDSELGREAFTYELQDGREGSVHIEQVLDYNEDPRYMRDLLLYQLTVEAQKRIAESPLSKREIIRRLGTSATQLYRLLDQTNYTKSVDQLLELLRILDCDVDILVKKRPRRSA